MLRKQSRMSIFLLLIVLAMTLTGCTAKTTAEGQIDRSGYWGKFVGFVSDGLDYFYHLLGDYGIAILVVTLIVRIIVFPLMMKQIRYQKVMQSIQPELAKIREKHKDDKEKINAETMKIFQQYGANPFSGCLPIIVQMPILFALYQAITVNPDLKTHYFLGFLALSEKQGIANIVLAILSAATTFLQSKMSMTNAKDPNTKIMLFFMPLMIAFFTWQFPAALGLYWIFGNILTIIQTYFTKGIRNAAPTSPEPAAPAKKSGGKSK
ncbi:YidC/Oxa1 family membrane protein insertase [Tumebacillus permanentifrigoris]|uniref:YidC/Oxa1 family membrane protein insertase n=1 Tax=Tumebacillus permanentifrigoris TaxID=378543 RepID=A0A316DEF6_9BACL|nr:YidC/Oxa1 family membrane protein insertase [Tumebacillus permanentifrigoris]PWK16607.1 YidC/Oxa1 family membrane protein insertase [Tumebacillus permanentifrigoris]